MSDLATLYRVSSPGQVKDDEVMPIPAQQNAARNFCSTHNHNLIKEYFEPGVSAYRKSAIDRNKIKEIISDAQKGLFTILLIFKTSRLSRRAAEYPWLIQELNKYGVIVWEVDRNKRLTPLTHDEKLTTYIDGWQAEGESLNISSQSRAGKLASAQQGGKNGGKPSYGFEVVDWTFEIVKKRPRSRAIWGINAYEVSILMQMADLCEQGHGSTYIARHLNTNGLLTRSGTEWSGKNIRRVLRNPALAGISMYRIDNKITNRTHDYKNLFDPAYYVHKDDMGNYIIDEKLKILPLDRWLNLMRIMDERPKGGYINPNRKQAHLLSGFIRCGYCGKIMTGVNNYHEHKKKDGTISVYDKSGYRCNSYNTGRTCAGPTQISMKKINLIFYYELDNFFTKFDAQNYIQNADEDEQKVLMQLKAQLRASEQSLKKTEGIRNKWLCEMDEYFARNGEYMFSKENIARKITEQEVKIRDLQRDIIEINQKINSQISWGSNIKALKKVIPNWYNRFKDKSEEVQNQMLKDVLEEVIVYRDRIEVKYKLDIHSLAKIETNDEFINVNKVVNLSSN